MNRRPTERPSDHAGSLSPEQGRTRVGRRVPPPSRERISPKSIPGILEEPIVIKMVPISADQLRVLESLDRALESLYADFLRDVGSSADDLAGGLYRLTSALGQITRYWAEEAEDLATVEGWRAALTQIKDNGLDSAGAWSIAADALE